MSTIKEKKFDNAMMDIYRRALNKCNYNATRYLNMLYEHRGLITVKILINATNVSEGYTALWERQRLDLTVEALILEPGWHEYFTDEERAIAKERLIQYGYKA